MVLQIVELIILPWLESKFYTNEIISSLTISLIILCYYERQASLVQLFRAIAFSFCGDLILLYSSAKLCDLNLCEQSTSLY